MKQTKILWISHLDMTYEQRQDLDRVYRNADVLQVDSDVDSASKIIELINHHMADVIATDLSINVLADLIGIIPIIMQASTAMRGVDMSYKFVHTFWYSVCGKVETKIL